MATPDDHALAADLATRAGALLIEVRGDLAAGDSSSEALAREGDQRSHEFLMEALPVQLSVKAIDSAQLFLQSRANRFGSA